MILKRKQKLTKKKVLEIVFLAILLISFREVISDWVHFKQGLFGLPFH